MKKLMILFTLGLSLLGCSSMSSTESVDAAQAADTRLNQSVDDQPALLGTPEEVQTQAADEQSASAEGYQNDISVDD